MRCWLNGELCDQAQAKVPALDRGFLYGETLFETLRFDAGGIHWLSRHLARIEEAAQRLDFHWPTPVSELANCLRAVAAANGVAEGVLRLTLSRGQSARGLSPAGASQPTLLITQSALPEDLASRWHSGYRLVRTPWRKPAPDMLPAWAKHGNYLGAILALRAAQEAGADDALLCTHDGLAAEATTSNLFFLIDGQLHTPDLTSGALPGILRAAVLECAGALGLPTVQGPIDEAAWTRASEVFLTNAVRGLMPVAAIDDQTYAVPGRLTQQLATDVRHATEKQ